MILEDAALAVPVSAHDHIQGNAHAVVTLVEYGVLPEAWPIRW